MKHSEQIFGEYVRLIKTREVMRWKTYDPKSQMLELVAPTGATLVVPRHEIDVLTPNEEVEFLESRMREQVKPAEKHLHRVFEGPAIAGTD